MRRLPSSHSIFSMIWLHPSAKSLQKIHVDDNALHNPCPVDIKQVHEEMQQKQQYLVFFPMMHRSNRDESIRCSASAKLPPPMPVLPPPQGPPELPLLAPPLASAKEPDAKPMVPFPAPPRLSMSKPRSMVLPIYMLLYMLCTKKKWAQAQFELKKWRKK